MASRWDYIYDLKPVALHEHFIQEAAKLLVDELKAWPLDISEWSSGADEARYRELMLPESPRPDDKVYAAAFLLASLELQREYEQIDDFMRNERWRAYTPPGRDYDAMQLLSKYLMEKMLAIIEATEGRIKRQQLVDLLARAEKRLLAPLIATV